jgi:hypothetical protein
MRHPCQLIVSIGCRASNRGEFSLSSPLDRKLADGETYFAEVGRKNNRHVLRAATPVPVVMQQCIRCHPGYKEGELLGALVYEVPIK